MSSLCGRLKGVLQPPLLSSPRLAPFLWIPPGSPWCQGAEDALGCGIDLFPGSSLPCAPHHSESARILVPFLGVGKVGEEWQVLPSHTFAAISDLVRRFTCAGRHGRMSSSGARMNGQRKKHFFLGKRGHEEYATTEGLVWAGSRPGACPSCGAHSRSWCPACLCAAVEAPGAHCESGPVPGLQAGSQEPPPPFAREHWGASVCTLHVSQLSLELWQSLALPGLFCALDPKLRITEGTLSLLTRSLWKLLSNGHFILSRHWHYTTYSSEFSLEFWLNRSVIVGAERSHSDVNMWRRV